MIERFELFADLLDEDRALLERVLVEERHRRGHTLMREGEAATSGNSVLYLLLEGQVRVTCEAPNGGFGVDRTIGPGDLIGLVALLDDSPRSATCVAVQDIRVGKLTRRVLDQLYKTNTGMHARFQRMVARQLAKDLRALDARLRRAYDEGAEINPI